MTESTSDPRLSGEIAARLRISIGERDHHGSRSLHIALLEAARRMGLSGATVFRGIEGFGAHSVVHAAHIIDLSSDLPILVEIIDAPERIASFLDTARTMIDDGLVTVEPVTIVYRSHGKPRS